MPALLGTDHPIEVHYVSSDDDLPSFPDDKSVVDLCKTWPEDNILKLSDSVLVKYRNVTLEECRNQVEARRLLDPSIISVPKVYRYFSKGLENYLIMEFIKGVVRDSIEDDESIAKVAQVIEHLQTHRSKVPGPLGGGISRGLFWENEEVELRSIPRLEDYLNHRMVGKQEGLHIVVKDIVLNHNDIAPRNIIWMSDGSICLIDWSHAGFYPRLIELVVLLFNTQQGKDLGFTSRLYEKLGPLTDEEEEDVHMMHMAWFNNHRYNIKPLDIDMNRQLGFPPIPRGPHQEGKDSSSLSYQSVPALEGMDARRFSEKLWQELQTTWFGKE